MLSSHRPGRDASGFRSRRHFCFHRPLELLSGLAPSPVRTLLRTGKIIPALTPADAPPETTDPCQLDAVRGVYGGPNLCHERSKTLSQGANVRSEERRVGKEGR